MAKRIFELAKELGINSKAIVEKCQAEGIPEAIVRNHMSTLSVGLEATIREWFATGGGVATAVETSAKIDVDTVKSKPSPRARKGGADHHGADEHHADHAAGVHAGGQAGGHHADHAAEHHAAGDHSPTAVEHKAAETASHAKAAETHAAGSHGVGSGATAAATSTNDHAAGHTGGHTAGHHAGDHGAGTAHAEAAKSSTGADASHADEHVKKTEAPAGARPAGVSGGPSLGPVRIAPVTVAAPAPETKPTTVEPDRQRAAAMQPSVRPAAGTGGGATGGGGSGGGSMTDRPTQGLGVVVDRPMGPQRTVVPAPTNVPNRPSVVTPAGPKLEQRAQVKLAGPKIVRVEAPEQTEAPRPRRPYGPSSGGGPSTGGSTSGPSGPRRGGGAGPAVADDESSRNARRRGGGGGAPAGGGGAGAAGSKRSSGIGVPSRRRASSGGEWVGGQVFSEQDLIERDARLARSGGFLKKRKQDLTRTSGGVGGQAPEPEGRVRLSAPFTIKDLSAATGVKGAEIVKKLFLQGVMATINSGIDPVKAQEIMMDFDLELEVVEAKNFEEQVSTEFESRASVDQRIRGPVVTILGHVDHGKTSLLDKIRKANVAAGEAGGITQRTSAFKVPLTVGGEDKEIVFLDTPGHEAFTSMRARGANMTDIVVLVVSAPEGVMPQTIESINHAKAAEVPIVVALNKIDRPDATEPQIRKVLGQLAEHGLNVTEWGGDVEIVRVSAQTGEGIPKLLETLDLQAQVLELTADFGGPARGTVIEAKMEEGRGTVASLLVQDGTLKVGDFIVAGRAFGKVRDIANDRGVKLREVLPPTPVQVSGLDELPSAGDRFYIVSTLKQAQEAAEQRRHREREAELAQPKLTLDTLFTTMQESDVKEIKIVLKAAEQGTLDVLKTQCEKVGTSEVKVRVLEAAIGGITESNVLLAQASQAIVIGFNVIPSGKARQLAEQKGVEIRTYQVIYEIMDDLKLAAEGMLAPELRQEILGHAEVRQVFRITKVGSIAGCYITDGVVQRDALIRVTRNGVVVENDRKLEQLKRFKDDAKDVRAGMECGMKIVGYDDIKEGDVLECYKQVEVKRTLGDGRGS